MNESFEIVKIFLSADPCKDVTCLSNEHCDAVSKKCVCNNGYTKNDGNVCVNVALPTSGPVFCTGKTSGNYPDPTRCDGFISCSNGILHRMDCPAGLWYDDKVDRCEMPNTVDCKCK